ncbi:MAG TPA: hypothetical protein VK815_13925 [Candidatus Acidoferrales bacterium]|nr:hypothetical protein [Candidatus Acidoferrales bacterium]
MSDLLHGGLKGNLRREAGAQPLIDRFAEMKLKLVEGHGSLDADGEHLLAPV